MRDTCQKKIDDPDEMARHIEECETCARRETAFVEIEQSLSSGDGDASLSRGILDKLPVAPWEGARHRSWVMVAIVGISIVALLVIAATIAGVSPAAAVSAGMGTIPGIDIISTFARTLGEITGSGDTRFHTGVVIGFIVINSLLLLLLRRRPRGIDA